MEGERRPISWGQIGMLCGSMAALAAVHTTVITPAILDRADIRARTVVESAHDRYITRVEFQAHTLGVTKQLDQIERQLDRITTKFETLPLPPAPR